MKQKHVMPAFKSDAEEAERWYNNRASLDKDFVEAARNGTLKRLDQATLKARLAASKSRVVSIRLPEDDIELVAPAGKCKGPALPDVHQICVAPGPAADEIAFAPCPFSRSQPDWLHSPFKINNL